MEIAVSTSEKVAVEQKVSSAISDLINDFENLNVEGRVVRAQFWMNGDELTQNRSYQKGGKLSPQELEGSISESAKKLGFNVKDATTPEINKFMIDNGIGIDCSGLSYQCLREAYGVLGGSGYEDKVKNDKGEGGITKINTGRFASDEMSRVVESIEDIKPGDFIIASRHIILVMDKKDNILNCVHVTNEVRDPGVHEFDIKILDSSGSIFDQDWSEHSTSGDKYIEILKKQIDANKSINSGIRRLRLIDQLYQANES